MPTRHTNEITQTVLPLRNSANQGSFEEFEEFVFVTAFFITIFRAQCLTADLFMLRDHSMKEYTMGFTSNTAVTPLSVNTAELNAAINLRLALLELPLAAGSDGASITDLMSPILARQPGLSRRLSDNLCRVAMRVKNFLK